MRLAFVLMLVAASTAHAQSPAPKADVVLPKTNNPGIGFLGIGPEADGLGGVRISEVRVGSPADAAGVQVDDLILKLGDLDAVSPDSIVAYIRNLPPGTELRIDVMRTGRVLTMRARLSEFSR